MNATRSSLQQRFPGGMLRCRQEKPKKRHASLNWISSRSCSELSAGRRKELAVHDSATAGRVRISHDSSGSAAQQTVLHAVTPEYRRCVKRGRADIVSHRSHHVQRATRAMFNYAHAVPSRARGKPLLGCMKSFSACFSSGVLRSLERSWRQRVDACSSVARCSQHLRMESCSGLSTQVPLLTTSCLTQLYA